MADRPADTLTDPQARQALPQPIDEVLSVGDWLNLSHWVMKAIELVCDVNPGQWVVNQFAGDWESFAKVADTMRNIGKFDATCGQNIAEGKDAMFQGWKGHAADRANTYFSGLAGAVGQEQSALDAVAKEIDTTAFGIWGVAKTLDSLLESLLDALIGAGIALAAAAASSETIIGGIIGGAAAAWEIKEAMTIWKQVIEAHDKAYNLAVGLSGTLAGLLGALHGLKDHPLPAGAYDHPGA